MSNEDSRKTCGGLKRSPIVQTAIQGLGLHAWDLEALSGHSGKSSLQTTEPRSQEVNELSDIDTRFSKLRP